MVFYGKVNTFFNQPIPYKTFFDSNVEYYDNTYTNKTFKLFDTNDEGGNESPYLKIIQKMTTGYNGKLVKMILNVDKEKDESLTEMKIRRVEIYDNGSLVEVAKSSNRHNTNIIISGGRNASVKKEICGRLRCIYKISGSRKEHVKHKGSLITVADYKKLMKNKT